MWASVAILLVLGGLVGAVTVRRGLDSWERGLALATLGAHFLAAFAQSWITEHVYEGVSDTTMYAEYGRLISRLLDVDFWRWAPEVVKLGLHLDTSLPFGVFGEGWSTGTMSAVTGTLFFFFGDHMLPVAVAISVFSWLGQLLLFRAARELVKPDERHVMMIASVAVPSVIFWSSALAKEALVVGWFGFLALGTQQLFTQRRLSSVPLAIAGAVGVAIMKPYILFPFFFGVGVAILAVATAGRFRAVYAVLGLIVTVGGMLVLGEVFPDYNVTQLAEKTADLQARGAAVGAAGGSYVELGGDEAQSFGGQLRYVPIAVINAFFRPAIFEARNITSLGAALETTALTVLVIALLVRMRPKATWRAIFDGPVAAFCLAFAISFAIPVGLATTNLGTLSRYRAPMMPLYVAFVLLLRQRLSGTKAREVTA